MSEDVLAWAATAVLAGIFVFPFPRRVLDERTRGFRRFVSFAAGISIAYVFIDLMPAFSELAEGPVVDRAMALPYLKLLGTAGYVGLILYLMTAI